MAGPAVEVQGIREVNKALRQVGAGTREMGALHRTIAARVKPAVAAEMNARSNRPTGQLAGSFRPRGSARKASVISQLVYAPIMEYGWPARGIPPKGAAAAVLDRMAPSIVEDYSREVSAIIDRAQLGAK